MFKAGESSISKEFLWIGDWAGRRASLTPNRQAIFDNLEKKTYTYYPSESISASFIRLRNF
jgi:hypothetical protein